MGIEHHQASILRHRRLGRTISVIQAGGLWWNVPHTNGSDIGGVEVETVNTVQLIVDIRCEQMIIVLVVEEHHRPLEGVPRTKQDGHHQIQRQRHKASDNDHDDGEQLQPGEIYISIVISFTFQLFPLSILIVFAQLALRHRQRFISDIGETNLFFADSVHCFVCR